jgi:hypothetical protein
VKKVLIAAFAAMVIAGQAAAAGGSPDQLAKSSVERVKEFGSAAQELQRCQHLRRSCRDVVRGL